MDLSARPRAKTCAEGLDEWSAHAFRRRREKYAAAVVLAVAISALAERAWAGALTGDDARGETL
jgi:hypothetical protein